MNGGGIIIDSLYNNNTEALNFFLSNCKSAKILSDSSAFSVTYQFTLNDNITSPFRLINSQTIKNGMTNEKITSDIINTFTSEVKNILVKFGLCGENKETYTMNFRLEKIPVYPKQIGVVLNDSFKNEVLTQHDIYLKSFVNNSFDAICPSIITYNSNLSETSVNNFRNILTNPNIFIERNGIRTKRVKEHGFKASDIEYFDIMFNNEYFNFQKLEQNNLKMTMIVMELMEGYDTLSNVINDNDDIMDVLNYMKLYELKRLRQIGYYHNDAHNENILVNLNYPYFTDNTNSRYYGRAMLIDFGLVTRVDDVNARIPKYINQLENTNFEQLDNLRKNMIDNINIDEQYSVDLINRITQQSINSKKDLIRNQISAKDTLVPRNYNIFEQIYFRNKYKGGKIKKQSAFSLFLVEEMKDNINIAFHKKKSLKKSKSHLSNTISKKKSKKKSRN